MKTMKVRKGKSNTTIPIVRIELSVLEARDLADILDNLNFPGKEYLEAILFSERLALEIRKKL